MLHNVYIVEEIVQPGCGNHRQPLLDRRSFVRLFFSKTLKAAASVLNSALGLCFIIHVMMSFLKRNSFVIRERFLLLSCLLKPSETIVTPIGKFNKKSKYMKEIFSFIIQNDVALPKSIFMALHSVTFHTMCSKKRE